MNRLVERTAPYVLGLLALALWQAAVTLLRVPGYVLPAPLAIAGAYLADAARLNAALGATLLVTGAALAASTVLGLILALAIAASNLLRAAIQPWAVILQVTPVVAIAPLIIIWVNQPFLALVVCATVVAFFPIPANTTAGLAATPPELAALFRLNGAKRWQSLLWLRLPAALPYFLTGLRISGTLALVGAVVAEFVAGSGGFSSGLAYEILEAGYRLEIPRMFAALALLAVAGMAIYAVLGAISILVLRRRGG